jgi:plastocyanin
LPAASLTRVVSVTAAPAGRQGGTVRAVRRACLPALLAFAALAAPAAAADVESTANGNVVTGGLRYAPADVTVPVGGTVAWRNTDAIAPHTVTERHGLWELTGGWGATPLSPPGFGPGTVAEREFEAGTHAYFCAVHPARMTGTVAVPVHASATRTRVRAQRRRGQRRRVRTVSRIDLIWAVDAPREGLAFDVQRRTPGGPWRPLADGTTAESGGFRTAPRVVWEVRARLRSAQNAGQATAWSPVTRVSG